MSINECYYNPSKRANNTNKTNKKPSKLLGFLFTYNRLSHLSGEMDV